MSRHRGRACIVTAGVLVLLAGGCSKRDEASAPPPESAGAEGSGAEGALVPVTLPELSRLEASVQEQVRQRYAELGRLQQNPSAPRAELGQAYGEVGKLLMAAEYFELAEPFYRNAQTLAPDDRRWPYYLGHLYKARGDVTKATASFQEALGLAPNDVATLVWLGELHLAEGRPEAAEPLFARALALQPRSLAVHYGLGRASLARKEYGAAVDRLETALALNDKAVNIHYPLAMAYRGLGDATKAEAHLQQQGKFEILPADPLMEELRDLLQSAISFEIRGTRALNSGQWAQAIAEFRQGLDVDPDNPSLRHKLGTALYMQGDQNGARTLFEQVVRESPEYAKAHYSLGVLLESNGRQADAMERFSTAVRLEPDYLEARVRLAGLLRFQGRLEEALTHYDRVLAVDPRVPEASFGSAMALVRLQRYRDARDRLAAGLKVHPDEPGFSHALARLLAAAPDAGVRDARQALAIMQALSEQQRRLDMGESMAMALAEAGRYQEAVTWQREAIAAARRGGNEALTQRMAANLRLYESGQPCRTPWRPEDMP